ncbi:MAG: ATP-binding cassette domain-containing protein, partial [Flavobacteriales bacterium]|nr:ATP-binding cassette domain-containing protein [Flavobacteriales bacterium]
IDKTGTHFLIYKGRDEVLLNGLPINSHQVYLFAEGAILKFPHDDSIYYNDITHTFAPRDAGSEIVLKVKDLTFNYGKTQFGIKNLDFQTQSGNLMGILGASGAGKSTLLRLLTGYFEDYQGIVQINGNDIRSSDSKWEGIIGFVPQEDALIVGLTVFENLKYCAQLCFANVSEQEIENRVEHTLRDLGILNIKDLVVRGTRVSSGLSGGQRKRLNIALELIREPKILIVDEPTTGLSSKDSENIMNLLKMQSKKGRLVISVIHQPSSDIFKMLDDLLILDFGGYPIYFGNPMESLVYFKTHNNLINNDLTECIECGNVNPELIFGIVDERTVDEKGNYSDERKVSAQEWFDYHKEKRAEVVLDTCQKEIENDSKRPNWFKQLNIYFKRDFTSKYRNKAYMLINFLEAPVLAFIIATLVKYVDPETGMYLFSANKNIPAFLFICVIVSMFMGLTLSAEEILRDRALIYRERFLNLNWSSYLTSKLLVLFGITAIQTTMFLIASKWYLEFLDLFWQHWMILFSLGCGSVLIGLIISSIFRSAVVVYILIPVLLIPQIVLSGAIFKYDELSKWYGNEDEVPLVADIMISRWAYESLMVSSFVSNEYTKDFFQIDQQINELNFLESKYYPKILSLIKEIDSGSDSIKNINEKIIKSEMQKNFLPNSIDFAELKIAIDDSLSKIKTRSQGLGRDKEDKLSELVELYGKKEFRKRIDQYQNEYIENTVRNRFEMEHIIQSDEELVRKKDLIYHMPNRQGMNYRSHLFAPYKNFMGNPIPTIQFNILFIWLFNLILIVVLENNFIDKLTRKL